MGGAAQSSTDDQKPETIATKDPNQSVTKTTTTEVTETESNKKIIPHDTETHKDASLPAGTTKVEQEGKDGYTADKTTTTETKTEYEVPVTIDVREVYSWKDHMDDTDVYFVTKKQTKKHLADGTTKTILVPVSIGKRTKYIDYAYPENDPRRITYSAWVHTSADTDGNPIENSSNSSAQSENTVDSSEAPNPAPESNQEPQRIDDTFNIKTQTVTINQGETLPEIKDFISDLPENASAEWSKARPQNSKTSGVFKAEIKVTVKDTSSQTTQVEVKPQTEIIAYNDGSSSTPTIPDDHPKDPENKPDDNNEPTNQPTDNKNPEQKTEQTVQINKKSAPVIVNQTVKTAGTSKVEQSTNPVNKQAQASLPQTGSSYRRSSEHWLIFGRSYFH